MAKTLRIVSWNINSVRTRLHLLGRVIKTLKPDVLCLQEIKCVDENFPREIFEGLGYNCAVHGQKTYNGVAILSKRPLEDVTPRLAGGDGDDHSRYLEAVVTGDAAMEIWSASQRTDLLEQVFRRRVRFIEVAQDSAKP